MTRSLFGLGLGLLCILLAQSAAADEVRQRCIAAFEDGQRLQLRGELAQAAQKFGYCRSEPCPNNMHGECQELLDAVQTSMPAIVFGVKVSSDVAPNDVWISIDDAKPQAYNGEALHVDLGKHQFAFGCDGCRTTTRRILFTDATLKRKEVELSALSTLPAQATQPAHPGRQATPEPIKTSASFARDAAFASTTALAALGGIGFVGFGLQARRADRNLDLCAPTCSHERVASVKRDYFWANASLGTGLVALLGSGLLLVVPQPANGTIGRAGLGRGKWALHIGPITTLTAAF